MAGAITVCGMVLMTLNKANGYISGRKVFEGATRGGLLKTGEIKTALFFLFTLSRSNRPSSS